MWENVDKSFFQEEVRCDYKISEEMKYVWAVELDLIGKLKDVCERNHLRYFMSGGTLLGAVRHQGFIPWDDDADFLMPREDFEKLKEIAPYEFRDPYFFQTEYNEPDIFMGGFARLRNSNTTKIMHVHMNHTGNFGIWIDISVMDYLYEDINKRKKQVKKIRHYQRLLYAKTYGEFNRFLEFSRLQWTIYKIKAAFFSRDWLCKQLLRYSTCCKDSKYLACFTYHYDRYWPFCLEKNDYSESIFMKFEWMELPAPIGYDRHLKFLYGSDYAKYPAVEKRTSNHSGLVDPLTPYKNYLLKFDRIFGDLEDKIIVIFGAGQMLEYYLKHEGKRFLPDFVVDNNKEKWGKNVHAIPIKQPGEILKVPREKLRVIICSIYYREIATQLRKMGIDCYYIYVQEKAWL